MENVEYSLVAIVVLLAANAFFVAAEFALVKVRGYQLDQAVVGRRHGAALSLRMHRNLDSYLAARQLGITMASLGLGWTGVSCSQSSFRIGENGTRVLRPRMKGLRERDD